ncbi:MAG: nickel pincer cofactor biosynthesis protein LarB [Bacteroidales bacterium]|nr:nickel pincer cofactor biosynthesis protein LarB [Bacteroidales bacterium]
MTPEKLKNLLEQVSNGKVSIDNALQELKDINYQDLGFAKIDHHRELRTGYPEVIFSQGKTAGQVRDIIDQMLTRGNNILATRATEEMYKEVKKLTKDAIYNPYAKTISIKQKDITPPSTYIAVVTAGTSDIPVAEEAAITAEIFGNNVHRIFDVGVAGIHRLYDRLPEIRGARVVVVIAGMEGALPSIVGGLVDKPVIAVPTSIGYGANFQGLSALLGMLTSCASGVSVVNIDNGFGAGYMASMINKL